MIRYVQYQFGDQVTALTYCYGAGGGRLAVRGKVLSDSGDRELVIRPDRKCSIFGKEKRMTVYKDQLI